MVRPLRADIVRGDRPTRQGTRRLGSGYLIYHGIRLARQAIGGVRESRRQNTPLPGDNPLGLTARQSADAQRVLDLTFANLAQRELLEPHDFIQKGPLTVPDWETVYMRRGLGWASTCVTCGFQVGHRLHEGFGRVAGYPPPPPSDGHGP
jgi:hypothetical protein